MYLLLDMKNPFLWVLCRKEGEKQKRLLMSISDKRCFARKERVCKRHKLYSPALMAVLCI